MTMLDRPLRKLAAAPLEGVAGALHRNGISANRLTLAGFAFGVIAVALIATGFFSAGLILLFLNRIADALDGAIARQTRVTALGAFLDALLDLFVYAAIPFAFALSHPQNALACAFLMLGLVVAYVPALASRRFGAALAEDVILCGHSETFIVFAVMCLVPWVFSPLAYLYGFFCVVSGGVHVAAALARLDTTAAP